MNTQKREFPQDKLNEFLDAFDEAHAEPDPEVKKEMVKEIQNLYGEFLQKYQRPANPDLNVEGPMIAALDYIPGAMRTAGGEALLGLQGKGDAKKAMDNLGTALNPFDGKLAPSSREFLDRAGMKGETPLSQTELGQKMGVRPGSWYDVTPKGAGATALDILTSPESFGALKGMAKGVAGKLAPKTAAEAELALAKETGKGGVRIAAEKAGQMLTNPSEALGDLMARWRFRHANRAAADKGRRAFSDVWQEHGAPGLTSDGLQDAAVDMIGTESAKKKAILNQVPGEGPKAPLSDIVDPAFQNPDFVDRAASIGDTEAYDAAQQSVRDEIAHSVNKRGMGETPQVSVKDLERLAKTAQDKAAAARQYSKPPLGAVKNLTDLKMTPANSAYGELWADIGMNARDAQAGMLDQVSPGMGGQVFEANKNISSIATGSPFINRSFNKAGNASSRARDFSKDFASPGLWSNLLNLGVDGSDLAATAGAKALLSRPVKNIVAPAARGQWVDDYKERKKSSPWTYMEEVK